MKATLHNSDCLDVMQDIPDASIDMVMADIPYGITANRWDSIIPLDPMWEQLKRIIKPNSAIVLTAKQPFTSTLTCSNQKMYRHCWIWNKNNSAGFLNAKRMPLQSTEDVVVFGMKSPFYYPQMEERGTPRRKGMSGGKKSDNYGSYHPTTSTNNLYYPKNIINISGTYQKGKQHPTQKPVALMEYLINTYTRKGEAVLDFCMGSGTTGVACKNLNRSFIGIEKDEKYFEMASERIEAA